MNVAVVIGVSQYSSADDNLPGCKTDADLISNLLKEANRYDEILTLTNETSSHQIKSKLAEFFGRKKDQKVSELFLYYSGHGEFHRNEFFFIPSDFDETKRNSTSLTNSELDTLIKSINPALTVKVIDACQSGVSYVKSKQHIQKYFNESKEGFGKCYFMFSSQSSQYSYQTENCASDFTQSFFDAIIAGAGTDVRYKDIVDKVSDSFAESSDQTPFFVIQADLTEVFMTVRPDIAERINIPTQPCNDLQEHDSPQIETKSRSLKELIALDAERYASKKEALDSLETIRELVRGIQVSPDVEGIYEIQRVFLDTYTEIPRLDVIGTWLKDNKHEYFAEPVFEKEPYEDEVFKTTIWGIQSKTVTRHKNVIKSFSLTTDSPYKAVYVNANSKFPNIPDCACVIVFVISKTSVRFFYFFALYQEESWDTRKLPADVNWKTFEVSLKDSSQVKDSVSKIMSKFFDFIISPLRDKFLGSSEQSSS